MKSDDIFITSVFVSVRKLVLIVVNSVENDVVYVEVFIATIFPEI